MHFTILYRIALVAVVLAPLGCTNVNQMHKLYQEGDHAQLDRILEIVSRQDYPYATRARPHAFSAKSAIHAPCPC